MITPGKDKDKATIAVSIGIMFALTLITLLFGLAWPGLQIQVMSDLPPVDPSTATPTPAPSGDDKKDGKSSIAYIELQVQSSLTGNWSVVQWQDMDGNWRDVEGWRGSLSENGFRRWTVEAKDFNTGPFRWVVMRGPSGAITGVSNSFNLPAWAGDTVQVTVSVQ